MFHLICSDVNAVSLLEAEHRGSGNHCTVMFKINKALGPKRVA